MNLEDLLIMTVPTKALRHVASANKLKPGGNSTENYAKIIASTVNTIPIGTDLVDNYRFAGKTSISLYKPTSGIVKERKNKDKLVDFLTKKYGEGLFSKKGIRIKLVDKPKLYKVYDFSNKLILAFTFLGPERRILKNYEIAKERQQYVDYLVIHFEPFILETRVPASKIELFKNSLSEAIDAEEVEWVNLSKLTDNDMKSLKNTLDFNLIGAKYKMTEGIYATKEVTANPTIEDLSEEKQYQEEFAGEPFRTKTFKFNFKHCYGLEEEISMKITTEGICFYSSVSEEVIDNIVNNILDIKCKNDKLINNEVAAF